MSVESGRGADQFRAFVIIVCAIGLGICVVAGLTSWLLLPSDEKATASSSPPARIMPREELTAFDVFEPDGTGDAYPKWVRTVPDITLIAKPGKDPFMQRVTLDLEDRLHQEGYEPIWESVTGEEVGSVMITLNAGVMGALFSANGVRYLITNDGTNQEVVRISTGGPKVEKWLAIFAARAKDNK